MTDDAFNATERHAFSALGFGITDAATARAEGAMVEATRHGHWHFRLEDHLAERKRDHRLRGANEDHSAGV
jgi:hypothetical protein